MTNTKISAPDLRHALCIGCQPALLGVGDLIVDYQFTHLVTYLRDECGVSLRRLDNALATLNLPAATKAQLRAAWGAK